MDFGSAILLTAVVFLIVELVARIFPAMTGREKNIAALGAGELTAFLVAHSSWAHKQVVSGIALDTMGWVSLVLVGLSLAGLAIVGKQVLNSVSNIGENNRPL